MATKAIRQLDLKVGEIVEIDGKRCEVVASRDGEALWLEQAVITVAEEDRIDGFEPLSQEEFDRLSAHLTTDGEG